MNPLAPNLFWNGSSVEKLSSSQLNTLKDVMSVNYQSELKGASVFHGTTASQAGSVQSGPKNVGSGLGGNGLYLSFEKDLASTFSGKQFNKEDNAIILEGKLQAENMNVGRIQLAQRGRSADLSKGIFPPNWSKDPVLQKFVNDHFDALLICNGESGGYAIGSDRYLVIHERAGASAITWNELKENPAGENFKQLVQQKNLTESYNSSNPNNPIQERSGVKGDIGGVACSTDYIEGLFESPEALFEQDHFFCMPSLADGQNPFSEGELRQILRELAIGIYVHGTVPFFSLHFNQNADLVPVIHPVYKDTLVGRVISMLDYMMKGYLNGGIFQEEFIDQWYKNPEMNLDSNSAFRQMISFTEYCEVHLEGEDKKYESLRLKMQHLKKMHESGLLPIGLADIGGMQFAQEAPILSDFSGFSNSFRIIAKQNSIQKEENLFILDSDFDVFYTLNPPPEYKQALEQHMRQHGAVPFSYQAMNEIYAEMCQLIHDHMVKMPICSHYFSMLGVINFFSGYFSTLKKHRKVPILPVFEAVYQKGAPVLFPHLPLQKICTEQFFIPAQHVLINYLEDSNSILSACFQKMIRAPKQNALRPSELLTDKEIENILETFKTELMTQTLFIKRSTSTVPFILSPTIKEKLTEQITEIASKELNTILSLFDDFVLNANTAMHQSLMEEFIIQNFQEKGIYALDIPAIITTSKSNAEEIELGKRVVGGCGMRLSRQAAKSSEKAISIWQNHWAELLSIKYECWKQIELKGDKNKKVLFRLKLQDLPIWTGENYSWMESLLVAPGSNDSQLAENRRNIHAAMNAKDKCEFKRLIDSHSLSQLSMMHDRYQRTLLHDTAALEDPFYMEALVEKGLPHDAQDVHGYKPIHYAAMAGQMNQLEIFLPHHQNSKSYDGSTPLIVGIQHNRFDIVARLLQSKAAFTLTTVGFNPLHCALHQRNLKMIHLLLDSIEHSSACLNELAEEEGSPLMLACEINSVELVNRLISMGAKPAMKRKDGMTAIEIAMKRNFPEVLACLLCHVQPSFQAIEEAVKNSFVNVIKLLFQCPSFYSHKNAYGDTALHTSIRFGNLSVALAIIENSPSIDYLNEKNIEDETAMDYAASFGFWNVVAALDAKGVNKNILKMLKAGYDSVLEEIFQTSSFDQETLQQALLITAQAGHHETIARILIPKNARIDDMQGPNGWKILHYLAKCDGLFLFRKLIARTNDVLNPLPQEGGKTLPYIAAEYSGKNILRYLLEILKKRNISLARHFNDRHLFYGVIETCDVKQVQLMLDIFKDSHLENVVLDNEETRPIHLAAKMGSKEVLQLLSNYPQVDLTIKDKNGFTPLDHATRAQSAEAICFLLEAQQGVTVTGTALFFAAMQKNESNLGLLVKFHPSTANANYALRLAIDARNSQAFFKLLQHTHAALDNVSAKGWTPLLLASKNGQVDILEYILAHTPLDKRSFNGNHSLHLASRNGHIHCAKLLIESGFDPLENNSNGKNSFQIASSEEFRVILNNQFNQHMEKVGNFQKALESNSLSLIKKAIRELPINDNISIKVDSCFISGTPLHLLLRLGKSQEAKSIVFKFLTHNKQNELRDSNGNTLAHLLVNAKMFPSHPFSEERKHLFPFSSICLKRINDKKQTVLHLAAKNDALLQLANVLDITNEDVNASDHEGCTPIFYAIKHRNKKSVEFLLKKGANLRHRNHQLLTPLILACELKLVSIVRMLIQYGADPNQPASIQRISPLHLAVQNKNDEVVRSLLQHGADCNRVTAKGIHVAHIAAEQGRSDLIRLFASKGISLETNDQEGRLPIDIAASRGKIETVAALLPEEDITIKMMERTIESGSPEGIVSTLDRALHHAALHGQSQMTKYLLQRHAKPQTKDGFGHDALANAALRSPKEMLERLFTYQVSHNSESLCSAISMAISNDNVDAMIALYNQGIMPNSEIIEGYTGLHLASRFGALKCTQWLLNKEADPFYPCESDKNAFEISASSSSYEQFNLLLDYTDVDVNLANKREQTLLHIAAEAGKLIHLMILIRKGALIDSLDSAGQTPLHVAAKEGHADLVALLLICGAKLSARSTDGRIPLQMVRPQDHKTQESFRKFESRPNESSLHTAIRNQNPLALSLLAKTSEINQQDASGISPLHLSVQTKQMQCMRILIQEGADLNIADQLGRTPLWYALTLDDLSIARSLIHAGADLKVKDHLNKSIEEYLNEMPSHSVQELI